MLGSIEVLPAEARTKMLGASFRRAKNNLMFFTVPLLQHRASSAGGEVLLGT